MPPLKEESSMALWLLTYNRRIYSISKFVCMAFTKAHLTEPSPTLHTHTQTQPKAQNFYSLSFCPVYVPISHLFRLYFTNAIKYFWIISFVCIKMRLVCKQMCCHKCHVIICLFSYPSSVCCFLCLLLCAQAQSTNALNTRY